MRTVALENSSLSTLLSSPSLIEKFRAVMFHSDTTAYIPEFSLQELCANENHAVRNPQLVRLAELATHLPRRQLLISADYNRVERAELAGAADAWPMEGPYEYLDVLRECGRRGGRIGIAEDLPAYSHRTMNFLFNLDRRVREALFEKLGRPSDQEISEAIRTGIGFSCEFMTFDWAAKLSDGRLTAKDIFDAPLRFPAIHAVSHLAFRQCLANLASPDGPGDRYYIGMFKTKTAKKGGKGNWGDIRVCATAVHADVFVVDDADLRRRAELLRHSSIIRFRSVTLQNLLEGAAA